MRATAFVTFSWYVRAHWAAFGPAGTDCSSNNSSRLKSCVSSAGVNSSIGFCVNSSKFIDNPFCTVVHLQMSESLDSHQLAKTSPTELKPIGHRLTIAARRQVDGRSRY